jgi:hypothetical protein
MPRFLFQPDPAEGHEFYPIPIDIHLGIIKIPSKEILDDNATITPNPLLSEQTELKY